MIEGKYAVTIIGYGGMARWHHSNLSEIPEVTVRGAYDINPLRNRAAEKAGLVAFESLDAALADEATDIILVATPNDVHKDITVRALRAGKHVLCEKPVALSSDELIEMQKTADECGKVFTIHQNRRFDEDFHTALAVIRSGELGDIFNIESRVHGSRGIPGDWRGKKQHGGGMVLDWGVHILDQLLLIYPGAKITSVYAQLTNVTNGEVDDGFKIFLQFDNGVIVLAEVGTSNFINLPRWYIQGANGTAVIEDFSCNGRIVTVKDWKEKDVLPVRTAAGLTKTMAPRNDDSVNQLPLPVMKTDIHDFCRNFIAAIEGRAELIVKPAEALRVMRLMEAAFRSAETGQAVAFEA